MEHTYTHKHYMNAVIQLFVPIWCGYSYHVSTCWYPPLFCMQLSTYTRKVGTAYMVCLRYVFVCTTASKVSFKSLASSERSASSRASISVSHVVGWRPFKIHRYYHDMPNSFIDLVFIFWLSHNFNSLLSIHPPLAFYRFSMHTAQYTEETIPIWFYQYKLCLFYDNLLAIA